MRQITTPYWLKRLPGDAYINSKEIVRLFGYSDNTSASHLAKRGAIPKPSRQCQRSFHKNLMWQVSEIRKFIGKQGETEHAAV